MHKALVVVLITLLFSAFTGLYGEHAEQKPLLSKKQAELLQQYQELENQYIEYTSQARYKREDRPEDLEFRDYGLYVQDEKIADSLEEKAKAVKEAMDEMVKEHPELIELNKKYPRE